MKISNAILGASLSVAASGAAALSLGASHGSVVLGAPVDLVFDVQPDPGTDVESSCVRVRLVAGDTVVPDSKVQITPVPASGGRNPAVRVRANVAADEPVFTATVTAGCTGGVTRHYTFLSQLPESAAASPSSRPVDIGQLAGAPAAGARPGTASGAPVAGGTSARAARVPASGAAAAAPARAARPRASDAGTSLAPSRALRPAAAAPAPSPATAAADRARLVMEPLDVWLDSPLPLRSSAELSPAAPEASAQQRAEAAALWKALNTPVEDVQRAAGRTAQLETTVAAERARAASERAAAADLRQRLDSAEADRFPAVIVYALLGLLVLLLALAAWLWVRARRAGESAWMQAVAASGQPAAPGGPETDEDGGDAQRTRPQASAVPASRPQRLPTLPRGKGAATASTRPVLVPPAPQPAVAPAAAPAFNFPTFADSLSGAVVVEGPSTTRSAPLVPAPVAPVPAAVPPAPAPVAPSATRAPGPHPEDLFDIQQQAEFFVSVGEHDQAIGVLKQHIAAHGDTSAFAYLELLRLYHTLGRVESFNQLREKFHAQFNARVPEFAAFHRSGRTLQGFPEALAAIEAEWSSPAVLGIIEGYLFRQADAPNAVQFDLAAYDDLLLLLAVAQTTPASARGAAPPRARTTPAEVPDDESLAAFSPVPPSDTDKAAAREQELRSLDSLSAGLAWESLPTPLSQAQAPTAPVRLEDDPDAMLDIDLSEPPHLTLSDLPPVPVTAPPKPGEPVGFGMDNDKLELRLELEDIERKHPPKG
ncbi:hypothetical protein [Paracidovorax konjaci]|uniref:hypothetical protein n=1 Tax=Paracidovorax konjaci TaxID=32040 RepID=UPI001FE331C1|nr:hypothetical protein [Paracidovorax konjaci]